MFNQTTINVSDWAPAVDNINKAMADLIVMSHDVDFGEAWNGVELDQRLTFEHAYIPQNISALSALEVHNVRRTDAKTVNPPRLSKATAGQMLVVIDAADDHEERFVNSWGFWLDDTAFVRVGISNFTQTEDNNPLAGIGHWAYDMEA